MMSLDEAIEYHEKEWLRLMDVAVHCDTTNPIEKIIAHDNIEIAKMHRCHIRWLNELKERREMDVL